jgi:hypothetical protein
MFGHRGVFLRESQNTKQYKHHTSVWEVQCQVLGYFKTLKLYVILNGKYKTTALLTLRLLNMWRILGQSTMPVHINVQCMLTNIKVHPIRSERIPPQRRVSVCVVPRGAACYLYNFYIFKYLNTWHCASQIDVLVLVLLCVWGSLRIAPRRQSM